MVIQSLSGSSLLLVIGGLLDTPQLAAGCVTLSPLKAGEESGGWPASARQGRFFGRCAPYKNDGIRKLFGRAGKTDDPGAARLLGRGLG
ncbi:MAG: hypothetical protein HY686_02205 [Chloroflexi bacterium]|nr:hypothetical protein [Chloroflexota bacterium]